MSNLAKKVTDYLLSSSFPYSKIVEQQVANAHVKEEEFPGYYSITYIPDEKKEALPLWLDSMFLSWQVCGDNMHVGILLFQRKGYVERLEIIEMAGRFIDWDIILSLSPLCEFRYDINDIRAYLSSSIYVTKMQSVHNQVTIGAQTNDCMCGIILHKCGVVNLANNEIPFSCELKIESRADSEYRYHVFTLNNEISVFCKEIVLRSNYSI